MNYVQAHDRLIQRARDRKTVPGYAEVHHVVPKAHGGSNNPDNLVRLTAKEHFIIHHLLFRIHKDAASARAYRLMADDQKRLRARGYAQAKEVYAASMRGAANVAKCPAVAAKISAALQAEHPYRGNKRPAHATLLRGRGYWGGESNPWHGTGARQQGVKNHMARAVRGVHPVEGERQWGTLQFAADELGVTIQAVSQAIRKGQRSRGWRLEHAA